MKIDIKSIIIDNLTKMFESNLGLVTIVFVVAIVAYLFRHDIAYDLDLTRREKNRFAEKTLLIPIVIGVATVAYLYVKEYYFLLFVVISVILTYILYWVGILDMIVEKLESRYGRY